MVVHEAKEQGSRKVENLARRSRPQSCPHWNDVPPEQALGKAAALQVRPEFLIAKIQGYGIAASRDAEACYFGVKGEQTRRRNGRSSTTPGQSVLGSRSVIIID